MEQRCKGCGEVIGTEEERDGKAVLRIHACQKPTDFVVYRLDGWCDCGEQIHWAAPDVILRRLINQSRNR